MEYTKKAREFCKRDAEVVLLFNPAPSQVTEISVEDYEPPDLLTERCSPKAHSWPRELFWFILCCGGAAKGKGGSSSSN